MRSIWKMKKKFDIQMTGKNLFMIVFEENEDLELILEGRPLLFRKQLIIFYRITKAMEQSKIRLVLSPF